jgi:type IV pilus assembly protein PilM
VAVDIPACALLRASHPALRRKSDEQTGVLFLDMGAGMTTAVMARGPEILLIKPLPMGGRSMDRLVARRLNLSPEDAALARRQWADSEISDVDAELSRAVGDAVRSEIESLAAELLMCIRYHNVTFRGNRIARTMIFGGEGNPRVVELLSGGINLTCDLGDPFIGMELSAAAEEHLSTSRRGQWAVAVGLCSKPLGKAA